MQLSSLVAPSGRPRTPLGIACRYLVLAEIIILRRLTSRVTVYHLSVIFSFQQDVPLSALLATTLPWISITARNDTK